MYKASPIEITAPAIFPTTGIASALILNVEDPTSAPAIILSLSVNKLVINPDMVSGEYFVFFLLSFFVPPVSNKFPPLECFFFSVIVTSGSTPSI